MTRDRLDLERRWSSRPPAFSLPWDGASAVIRDLNHSINQGDDQRERQIDVAPAILRLHLGLDEGQRELIGHLGGPILGIAGPGSGKTLAVALRGANILLQGKARPEEVVLCTYSRAAARELRQRFIALATAAGCRGDLSRVRIGTIHSLCRRILRSHARRAGLRPGFQVLNEDDQRRLLSRNFDDVFGPDLDAFERAGVPVERAASGSRNHQPAGGRRAITVTTIHQAKGREWDVVIVGSLGFDNADVDPMGRELAPYCKRPAFEPADRIADFDHARQHYVACSRARGLLVLTASGSVHSRFADAWEGLPRWDRMDRQALGRQRFRSPEPSVSTEDSNGPARVRVIPYLKRLDVRVSCAAALGPMSHQPEGRRLQR